MKFVVIIFTCAVVFISCNGGQGETFNEKMDKISRTVNAVDSAASKLSKDATVFSKDVEGYVDTSRYQKDTSGVWKKKQQ